MPRRMRGWRLPQGRAGLRSWQASLASGSPGWPGPAGGGQGPWCPGGYPGVSGSSSTPYCPLSEALLQALRDSPLPADGGLLPWRPALRAIIQDAAGAAGYGAAAGAVGSGAVRGVGPAVAAAACRGWRD